MDREREEVYERIPWETLDQKKGGDRQWLMFAVAGAIVVGSLAYSFMSNRPQTGSPQPTVTALSQAPAVTALPAVPPTPTVTSPVVMAEADLYAVDPERLIDRAMAHAEWFATEYFNVDGSQESQETITGLLPDGVPPPEAPEGTRVFVEWARAVDVEQLDELHYRVDVLVRSLVAEGDEGYRRQAPILAKVEVVVDEEGARVTMPPVIGESPVETPEPLDLSTVPDEMADRAMESSGGTEVVGGIQGADGGWLVVVMVAGADGVSRPVTVVVP